MLLKTMNFTVASGELNCFEFSHRNDLRSTGENCVLLNHQLKNIHAGCSIILKSPPLPRVHEDAVGLSCMLKPRNVQHTVQTYVTPINLFGDEDVFLLLPARGKGGNYKCWVKCLVNLIFAYGFWMDSSSLIFTLKACCALPRVPGTASWAQQTLLVTLLPISLFTALRKPWLYCTISPDFIYVRDFTQTPKLFMLSWMSFGGRYKSVHIHIDGTQCAHTHSVEGSISAGHGPSHPFWFKVCLFSSPESPINNPWLSKGAPPLSSLHFHFPHSSVSGSPEAGAAAELPPHAHTHTNVQTISTERNLE